MALRSYLVGEVTEDYSDGLMSRREALQRLTLLGVTASSASALLAACAPSAQTGSSQGSSSPSATGSGTSTDSASSGASAPASASPGGAGERITFSGPAGHLQAAWAAAPKARAAVLVVHENRGLTPHFLDLVGRFARDGYSALCVDLLSRRGGTTALSDPGAAPAALANTPLEQLVADLRAGVDELQRRVSGKKVGAVGFCFGGGMVWNLLQAGEARLAAAVPFYGPAPETADFSKAKAAVLAIYAGEDARVNASRDRAEAALKAAGNPYEIRTFPGVDHAFFNDTGPRYNAQAATAAYSAVLDWFGRYLS